jgi:hypothetical protein
MVTFSSKFANMDKGCDFDGTHAIVDRPLNYLGLCGQMLWTDYWLEMKLLYRIGLPNLGNATHIAVEKLITRLRGEDKNYTEGKPDFLQ